MSSPRVAILGGSFDPFHVGHLAVALQVRDTLLADAAWLIPAGEPPLHAPVQASGWDRLEVCRAVVGATRGLEVLDIEVTRPGPSYTVDTMRHLRRGHPNSELWIVLGADAARQLPLWHHHQQLLAENFVCLVNRDGMARMLWPEAIALGLEPARGRIVGIDSPPISATLIRERIAAGQSIDDLVGSAAARLIAERGLYRDLPSRVP